jgi:hypothetical protein
VNIINRLKTKYRHKAEKKYVKSIKRRQLNFNCSQKLVTGVSLIAARLEVPLYCLLEHLLQVGAYHVAQAMQDQDKREKLMEHLVKVHLRGEELSDDEEILKLG